MIAYMAITPIDHNGDDEWEEEYKASFDEDEATLPELVLS